MNHEKENTDTIKVLILSDRLVDNAKKLSDYLISAGIQVIAVTTTKEEALSFCEENIKFLIIVGYLKDTHNYDIIAELTGRKNPCVAVHWAILDEIIKFYCSQYKIPLQFDRTLPMSDFVLFLEQNRNFNLSIEEEKEKSEPKKFFWFIGKQFKEK